VLVRVGLFYQKLKSLKMKTVQNNKRLGFSTLLLILLSYTLAGAQQIIDQNKFYNIILSQNGELLTNPGHAPNNEDKVSKESEAKLITQKRGDQDKRQQWRFVKVNESDNLFMIVNRHFNNYIDIPFGRKNQNETIIGYKNKGGQNQQFYLIKVTGNNYLISSSLSGYALGMVRKKEKHCLYRDEKPTLNGSVDSRVFSRCDADVDANYVKQVGLTGAPNQQWMLIEAK
jgi:hypothetical protein